MDIRKDILWRIHLCFLGVILLGIFILSQAFYIQQVKGDYWKKMAGKQHLKYVNTDAERGTVFSSKGNMLSTSVPEFDIYIDFAADGLREKKGKRFYEHLDSLSYRLSHLFGDASTPAYKKELLSGYKKKLRYYVFKKKISFDQYRVLREFPLISQGQNKSGFIVDVRDNRITPYGLLANRTIGLARGKLSNNVGLERSYDSVLRGKAGQRLVRYVAGSYIPVDGAEIEPRNGKNIITTLDTYIQDVTENALLKMMTDNQSLSGSAIVMEVKTGKIKAIANLGRMKDGSYWENYNYGLARRTEPGSVFKLATLLALLEDGYVDTSSIVDCEGGQKLFYGLRITDSHLGTHEITVKQAFAQSSNVAFAKMADEYYENRPEQFYKHLEHIHFTKRSGIDIIGTAEPYIKKPSSKYWRKTTIPFMAHGYEELLTPLQLIMLYNAVANDGEMMKPYLVNAITDGDHTLQSFRPEVLVKNICSKETLGKLKACLLAVVESPHGTANALKSDYYLFGGKTGTAVSAMDNRGYNKGNKIYQSAFIGFFPYNNPKYTIAVVIQNSKYSKHVYGGSVAGPVFKEIADRLYANLLARQSIASFDRNQQDGVFKFYGLNSDVNKIMNKFSYGDFQRKKQVPAWSTAILMDGKGKLLPQQEIVEDSVPDVLGMGLKDAVYLLEQTGLKVSVSGRGQVVSQSLAQNTKIRKGESIKIVLN